MHTIVSVWFRVPENFLKKEVPVLDVSCLVCKMMLADMS